MSEKLQAYLDRIAYTGETEPTIENLRAIHRAHMMAVPFENLDIHVRRWIVLDDDKLFHKIVNERRGGFCFEQNGLFYQMLRLMGYDVQRIEANVYSETSQSYSIPMNHMALLVTIDGIRYLADVGFGDSYLEPLELDNPAPQIIDGRKFKVEHDGITGYYKYPDENGDWKVQYRFFFLSRQLADYADACYYMQTSPKTHFTQKRICSKATPEGRVSLSDLRLIERVGETKTETPLADEAEFEALLKSRFGIDFNACPRYC